MLVLNLRKVCKLDASVKPTPVGHTILFRLLTSIYSLPFPVSSSSYIALFEPNVNSLFMFIYNLTIFEAWGWQLTSLPEFHDFLLSKLSHLCSFFSRQTCGRFNQCPPSGTVAKKVTLGTPRQTVIRTRQAQISHPDGISVSLWHSTMQKRFPLA